MINANKPFSMSRLQSAKTMADGGRVSSEVQNIFQNIKPAWWSPKVGTNKINIIPYEIKTKFHPMVLNGSIKLGTDDAVDFCYPLSVHRYFGPLHANVICPRQFNQPCPICEQANALSDAGQKDEARNYWPSKRVFYNVEDVNEPGTVKLFESSNDLFQKELLDEAYQGGEEGTCTNFPDINDGKTVVFRASEVEKAKFKYLEFKSFKFENRNPIPQSTYSQAISLDEHIKLYSYQDLRKIMMGELPDSNSEPAPVQTSTIADQAMQQPLQPAQQSFQQMQPVQPQIATPVQPQMATPVQPQVQQAPQATTGVSQPAQATNGLVCPYGYVCGKDTDTKPECDTCQNWEKCIEAV